jgi:alpha-glucosidase (family GH31 glycosyl hydrolase)
VRRLLALPLLPLVFSACSPPTETLSPAPVPFDTNGGFSVALQVDRLVVASRDGRVLLDGLAPADPVNDYDPPLTGFAVRDISTTYEMEFGAFKPTQTPKGPWRVAKRLLRGADGALEVRDDAGALLAKVIWSEPESGHLVADVEPGEGPERRFSWGFKCDENDHFAGFGSQAMDVDHRGFTVPTFVQEQGIGKSETDDYTGAWFIQGTRHASHIPIPQYLSRRGYILTTETDLRSIFALCSEEPAKARVEIEMPAKIHVFDGPKPAQAIERATATFGRPRLPPKVAFAPWLDAIFGSQNVSAVAKKLREKGIPGSVIWSEDWRGGEWVMDDYKLEEEWDVDTTLYPDMKSLSNELHGEGFDFFVYFNPFVYKSSKAWQETAPNGLLVKTTDGQPYTFTGAKFTDTGLIDLDNPAGRAWAVGKMRAAMLQGADGWMNDFAEWLPTDGMTAAGPSLPRHDVYPVLWQETAREAIDGMKDGEERLFFGRSGWFGTPALADVIWAGDQRTDFEPDDGFPTVLPIGIGLGLVGVSTYGHDIAGYQSATNAPSTKELFFRWTALGAWSPVMRTHHGTKPLLEWSWDKDDETIAHFKRYAELHIALVPYLTALAKNAAENGLPIWRGLMIGYPDDAKAWGIKDEVMLGDGLLVAPVVTAGTTSRKVYLPEGDWFPWSGGPKVAGGAEVDAPAPLTEIPVFAAAGTLVSAYPDGVMTLVHGSAAVPDASSVGDDRVVYAFLGASGSFTEEGGLAYAIEHTAAAAGALDFTWYGAPLAACDAQKTAPCVEATADGAIARVVGPGTLAITSGGAAVAKLTATGGATGRKLTFVIRK